MQTRRRVYINRRNAPSPLYPPPPNCALPASELEAEFQPRSQALSNSRPGGYTRYGGEVDNGIVWTLDEHDDDLQGWALKIRS